MQSWRRRRRTRSPTGFAEKRQAPAKPIGAYSAAQEKANASRAQAQEDIDDIDEIFKIFNRNCVPYPIDASGALRIAALLCDCRKAFLPVFAEDLLVCL